MSMLTKECKLHSRNCPNKNKKSKLKLNPQIKLNEFSSIYFTGRSMIGVSCLDIRDVLFEYQRAVVPFCWAVRPVKSLST